MPNRRKKRQTPKPRAPRINLSPEAFETAFYQRLMQTPLEWVTSKAQSGSELSAVRYLYEISAAEIARQANCRMQPFDRYYSEYLKHKEERPALKQSVKVYNKLVRDRIPEILAATGKVCTIETLTNERYLVMLNEKLNEEIAAYQRSQSLEKLADLLEVMGAVVRARGCLWDDLTAIRRKKREVYGGYEKQILLKEVSAP